MFFLCAILRSSLPRPWGLLIDFGRIKRMYIHILDVGGWLRHKQVSQGVAPQDGFGAALPSYLAVVGVTPFSPKKGKPVWLSTPSVEILISHQSSNLASTICFGTRA